MVASLHKPFVMHFLQKRGGEGVFLGVGDHRINTATGAQSGLFSVNPNLDLFGIIDATTVEATASTAFFQGFKSLPLRKRTLFHTDILQICLYLPFFRENPVKKEGNDLTKKHNCAKVTKWE